MKRKTHEYHGLSYSREYRVWWDLLNRCHKPKTQRYKDYGGRGITVCESWRNSFEAFYKDMGKRPSSKHSIERINNDEGYSKENCRWATRYDQNRNRRGNVLIEMNDRLYIFKDACRMLKLNPNSVLYRLRRDGGTHYQAIHETLKEYGRLGV